MLQHLKMSKVQMQHVMADVLECSDKATDYVAITTNRSADGQDATRFLASNIPTHKLLPLLGDGWW